MPNTAILFENLEIQSEQLKVKVVTSQHCALIYVPESLDSGGPGRTGENSDVCKFFILEREFVFRLKAGISRYL